MPDASSSKSPGEAAPSGETERLLAETRHDLASIRLSLQSLVEERTATSGSEETNLLDCAGIAVLLLSNELKIRQFTAPASRLLNARPSDVGRPFEELRTNLRLHHLGPTLREVLETRTAREIETEDREGRWHLLRISPHPATGTEIEGLVVVILDIDAIHEARELARAAIQQTPVAVAVVDREHRIRLANDALARLTGIDCGDLEQKRLPELAGSLWGLDEPLRSRLAGLANGGSFEFEHRTPATNSRALSFGGQVLRSGNGSLLLVTIEDTTAQHATERLLAKAAREAGISCDQVRTFALSLFTSQTHERRRVARELHDDISQRLARLEIDAETLTRELNGTHAGNATGIATINRLRADIAKISADVRRISHRLHPSILDDLGLGAALRAATDDFREREQMIATYFEENVPESLAPETSTVLHRIADEALLNAAQHAGRTHVKVLLRGDGNKLRLEVLDAGLGFDPDDSRPGVGLITMQELARQIGATLKVVSALGEGTRVTVDVPLPPA